MTDYAAWIGKQKETMDQIDSRPMRLMQAMLNRSSVIKQGDALPPLWHWLYFHSGSLQETLDEDGHAQKGDFLPPISLPRRMWAGGRFKFTQPLRIGDMVRKVSTIKAITPKVGRKGELCFVTVEHQFFVSDVLCFSEEHDIVYREQAVLVDVTAKQGDESFSSESNSQLASQPRSQSASQLEHHIKDAQWYQEIKPDPVLLFRYSALTFNGHRIHYDRDYCREVEGYPGLVFHGPLTATLLLDLTLRNSPDEWVTRFEFRALSPLFDINPFGIGGDREGNQAKLWAINRTGVIAMNASVEYS